jgi:hypothetical protein
MSKLRGSSHPEARDLYILESVQAGFGAQPVTYSYSVRVEGSCPDGKVTSASSSVISASDEVRNDWNYTFMPSYVFMMCRRTAIR